MHTQYSAYYHDPNPINNECGIAYITTNVSSRFVDKEINRFTKICQRTLQALNNLVSACSEIESASIFDSDDEEERSTLKLSISLAGNFSQENGKFEIKTMNKNKIFELAKEIIEREISKQ